MTSLALIFSLAMIGISETAYLIKKRLHQEKAVCFIGGNCNIVLESKYNKIFFIHNDVLGFVGYFLIGLLCVFLVIGIQPNFVWNFLVKIFISLASLLSAIFVFIQWKIIKHWCFFCVMSALTIWLMQIIILFSNF